MTATRRKAIDKIVASLDDLKGEIETLRDEERDYYDNLSEKAQESERGEKSDQAANALEAAADAMGDAISAATEAMAD